MKYVVCIIIFAIAAVSCTQSQKDSFKPTFIFDTCGEQYYYSKYGDLSGSFTAIPQDAALNILKKGAFVKNINLCNEVRPHYLYDKCTEQYYCSEFEDMSGNFSVVSLKTAESLRKNSYVIKEINLCK